MFLGFPLAYSTEFFTVYVEVSIIVFPTLSK
jgi:hypothetical protein